MSVRRRGGRVFRVPANFATNTVKYGSWQGMDEKGNQDILITVGDGVSSFCFARRSS